MNIVKLLIDTQALILPGILLALVVVSLLYNISKRSKYQRETNDLEENLQVGDKVKTYAGIYGVVESIREALDGSKVVLIKSGEGEKVSYYSMDIAAIYSLDVKDEEEKDEDDENSNQEVVLENEQESIVEIIDEESKVEEEFEIEVEEQKEEPTVEEPVVEEEVEEIEEVEKTKTTSNKKTSTAKKTTASKTKKDK